MRLRLANIQALRAIAALGVVGVHLSGADGFPARYLGGDDLTWWLHVPGQAGIDLFFVISGVIMAVTTWGGFGRGREARRFLWRRVTRIYPPYWVATTAVLAVFLVRPGMVNSSASTDPGILQSYLLLPQQTHLVAVAWTLVHEMLFYFVFAAALLFRRAWLPWILGAWVAVTLGLHVAFPDPGAKSLEVASSLLNIEFVFGVIVGALVMTGRIVAPRAVLAVSAAVLLVLLGVSASRTTNVFPSEWFRVFAIGTAMAGVIYGAVGIEHRFAAVAPKAVQRLGDASYSLYLWHVAVLSALGRVADRLLPESGWAQVVGVLTALAITVAISVLLHRHVERPLLRLFRERRHVAEIEPQAEAGDLATAPRPHEAAVLTRA